MSVRPTSLANLNESRATAYCACSSADGVVWTFFSVVYHFDC